MWLQEWRKVCKSFGISWISASNPHAVLITSWQFYITSVDLENCRTCRLCFLSESKKTFQHNLLTQCHDSGVCFIKYPLWCVSFTSLVSEAKTWGNAISAALVEMTVHLCDAVCVLWSWTDEDPVSDSPLFIKLLRSF